ncbi:putative pentatricopeptide repeat-containing protein [Glycine max]|nr:putative pentatricopeptide repeat-containing protein [Glycine max]
MNGSIAKPIKYVLCTALSSCAKSLNWHLGIQIHAYMIRSGHEDNLFLSSALVDFYAKCFAIVDARKCSVCVGQNGALEHCSTLHASVIKRGYDTNNFVVSSLIDCYANSGQIDDAALLFDETNEKDIVVYNSMISGYSKNLYSEDTLKLFVEMRGKNLNPTDHTLCTILNACNSLAVLFQGRQVHSLVIKMGSEGNVFVASALNDMYSKGGNSDEAQCVLDQTSKKNNVLYHGLELIPDHICFTAVLTACNHAGFLDKGVEYINKMTTNYGLSPDIDQYACLLDLYAGNGNLSKARDLMEEMPYDPNYVIWSSFFSSCKIYGDVELGREAADQLIKMKPGNAAPHLTLAHIYARKGLWNEVAEVRRLMQQRRIRKPAGWSWVEVDKQIHVFAVDDVTHQQSNEIYRELEYIYLGIIEASSYVVEDSNILA